MGEPECLFSNLASQRNSDLRFTGASRTLQNPTTTFYQGVLCFFLIIVKGNVALEVNLGLRSKGHGHIGEWGQPKNIIEATVGKHQRVAIPLHEIQLLRCITKPQVHTGFFGIIGICQHQIFLAPFQQVSGRVFNPELIRNRHSHFDTHSSRVIPKCLISDQ